jgi:hypothetical protein
MKGKSFFGLIVSLAVLVASSLAVNAQARLTEQSKVSIYGIGSVRVGMTINEVQRVAGVRLVQTPSGGEEYGCFYYEPSSSPSGVSFIVTNGRIARVDINNPRIATIRGVGIGDTENRIKSVYSRQIQVTPHTYMTGGHYLTFIPKDSADKNYRIVFETDNNRVIQYRAGRLPEVEYVEGCA